eukprot:PhF_6_TR20991/c0_g1_i2/m.30117
MTDELLFLSPRAQQCNGYLTFDQMSIRDRIRTEITTFPLKRMYGDDPQIHIKYKPPLAHPAVRTTAGIESLPPVPPGKCSRPSSAGMYFVPKVEPPKDITTTIQAITSTRKNRVSLKDKLEHKYKHTILRVVHHYLIAFVEIRQEVDLEGGQDDTDFILDECCVMSYARFAEAMEALDLHDKASLRAIYQRFSKEDDHAQKPTTATFTSVQAAAVGGGGVRQQGVSKQTNLGLKSVVSNVVKGKPQTVSSTHNLPGLAMRDEFVEDIMFDGTVLVYTHFMDELLRVTTMTETAEKVFSLFDLPSKGVLCQKDLLVWRKGMGKLPPSVSARHVTPSMVKAILNLFDQVQTQELISYVDGAGGGKKKGKKKSKGSGLVLPAAHEVFPPSFRRSDVIGPKYFAHQFKNNQTLVCDL